MESKGARQTGAAPTASPLLSSQSSDHFCVFYISPPPHHEISRGVLYIIGFRSRHIHRVQDCVERTHEGEVGPTMRPTYGLVSCPLFPTLLCSPLTSSLHDLLFPKKMTWQKDWIRLRFRRSLKVKNMQKQATHC
jgi:hypothetical protein